MTRWRLISDKPNDGAYNMAVDEAILLSCEKGISPPTLRFYEWVEPTLSIGYLQDSKRYRSMTDLPLIRRITGGRAVLHGSEITYSIAADYKTPCFSKGICVTYLAISKAIRSTLQEFSIDAEIVSTRHKTGGDKVFKDACFSVPSKYEIAVRGRKLVGSSQKRLKKAFLQHGSIPIDIDRRLLVKLFGSDILCRIAWVALFKDIDRTEFKLLFVEKLSEMFCVSFSKGELTGVEEAMRDRLIEEKYRNEQWNWTRKPSGKI